MKAIISRDFIGGIAAIVIGSIYLVLAYNLGTSALDDLVGPAGMPRVYGWLMLGLGMALCATAAFSHWREDMQKEWVGEGRRIAWAAGLLGLGVIYLLIVTSVGYLVSMFLLIAATVFFHGERASVRMFAISALGAVCLWALFVHVLDVPMPPGLLSVIAG